MTLEGLRLTAFLSRLAGQYDGPCLTVYMPTHQITARQPRDRILFKNLLKEGRDRLMRQGMSLKEAGELLEPAFKLHADSLFWEYQGNGLALFVSRDFFEYLISPLRFHARVLVSHRFYLKPLLPALLKAERFFLLGLSRKEVRLTMVTDTAEEDLFVQKTPQGLWRPSVRKTLKFHTGTPEGRGRRAAMPRGHGTGPLSQETDLLGYYGRIDADLLHILNEEKLPMLLAGPNDLVSLYRQVNTYPYLVQDATSGNPGSYPRDRIYRLARKTMEAHLLRLKEEVLGRFKKGADAGKICTDIAPLLQAATEGRVEFLLLSLKGELTARHDMESGRVDLHADHQEGDLDLVDEAVARTILTGGRIVVVESDDMPSGLPLAAFLREDAGAVAPGP